MRFLHFISLKTILTESIELYACMHLVSSLTEMRENWKHYAQIIFFLRETIF